MLGRLLPPPYCAPNSVKVEDMNGVKIEDMNGSQACKLDLHVAAEPQKSIAYDCNICLVHHAHICLTHHVSRLCHYINVSRCSIFSVGRRQTVVELSNTAPKRTFPRRSAACPWLMSLEPGTFVLH